MNIGTSEMKKYEKSVVSFDKSAEAKYKRNPDFILREIAGEYVLVPGGSAVAEFNGLASLNETGVFLWNLLGQTRTMRELSEGLAAKYELTKEQSHADVADYLEVAVTRGLVRKL